MNSTVAQYKYHNSKAVLHAAQNSVRITHFNFIKVDYKDPLVVQVAGATMIKTVLINILIVALPIKRNVEPMMTASDTNATTNTHRYAYVMRPWVIILMAKLHHDNNESISMTEQMLMQTVHLFNN